MELIVYGFYIPLIIITIIGVIVENVKEKRAIPRRLKRARKAKYICRKDSHDGIVTYQIKDWDKKKKTYNVTKVVRVGDETYGLVIKSQQDETITEEKLIEMLCYPTIKDSEYYICK